MVQSKERAVASQERDGEQVLLGSNALLCGLELCDALFRSGRPHLTLDWALM